jgi:hypothetical protein
MLHKVITHQRPSDAAVRHEDDLRRFATTVFDREPLARSDSHATEHCGVELRFERESSSDGSPPAT